MATVANKLESIPGEMASRNLSEACLESLIEGGYIETPDVITDTLEGAVELPQFGSSEEREAFHIAFRQASKLAVRHLKKSNKNSKE